VPDSLNIGTLDRIKFTRISMLTDPALDAGRHEFELRTLLGRILPPEESLQLFREQGWIPPVREIYPLIIGSMSFGALSPAMWEGLQMGIAYLNEELGIPARMCTGEGGCPPRLLRSRFLKYTILLIASGYLAGTSHPRPSRDEGGPLRNRDQVRPGREPATSGHAHVVQGQQAHRGDPRRSGRGKPASPPTHQRCTDRESVAKMIQAMYMAWGFRVPVYPKIREPRTPLPF